MAQEKFCKNIIEHLVSTQAQCEEIQIACIHLKNDLPYSSFQLINQVTNNYEKHTVVPVFRAAKYLFEFI